MATNRDVKMTLQTQVEGGDDIKKLSDQVRDLAKAGGEAAPGFEKLAAAVDANDAALTRAREAEKSARTAIDATKASLQEKKDAQRLASIETDSAAKKTGEYQAATKAANLEIFAEEKALRAQAAALKQATAEAKAAAVAQKALETEAKAALAAASKGAAGASTSIDRVSKSTGEASDLLRRLGPLMTAAFSADQFVRTIAAQESLNRGFEQIFGSAGKARSEMEFIRATADKLGIEVQTLARSYQSLAASTKGTVLEGQATRDVFEAVSRAMSVLGKTSAETEHALVAVSQIASKGTASMEELRGQLGEALPGAMKAAADGAGITVEQLVAMVSNGQVLAADILPALTKGLNDLYAKAAPPQTITSEWARLKNTITDTMVAVGEGGASKGIAKGLSALAVGVQGVSHATDVAGTAIGEFIAKVATGNYELGTAAELNAKYDKQLRQAAEAAGLVDKALNGATNATQAQARAVDNAVDAQTRATTVQKAAGESALAMKAHYAELSTGAEKYTDLVKAQSIAHQAESAVLVQLVGVYGSDIEKRQAAAAAAQVQATASRDVARALELEAILAQSRALALQTEAAKRNDTSEATKKEIEAAQQNAAAKRAEADGSRALATSKGIEAEATKASAAAYADNSARVYELRGAAQAAATEVERLVAAQKDGKATSEQVADAHAKASAALLLYRDALKDATAAAERKVQAEQINSRLAQGAINVDRLRAGALEEVARASGDAAGAARAHAIAQQSEINAARTAADTASREAQAIREAAEAKENELRATGQLTPAKEAEIQATLAAAAAKQQESDAAAILADKLQRLLDLERKRTQQQEENKPKTADGFEKNKDGSAKGTFNNLAPLDKAFEAARTRGEGMSVEELKAAKRQADDAGAWLQAMMKSGGAGSISPEAFSSTRTLQAATASALEDAQRKAAADERQRAAKDAADHAPVRPEAAQQSTTHTVNINLPNGTSGSVNVASPSDANVLTALLGQLSRARGVS
ncbi:tape measure protein [Variovorax humicola]|uniref:Tape measure protein n=1 Tax=Variovorax humicola TaxID=1769758 RepID=A0ABU8VW25_9BURK